MEAATAAAFAAALWLGADRVTAGQLGLGELVAVLAYVQLLAGPLSQLGDLAAWLRMASAATARLDDVYHARPSVTAVQTGPDGSPGALDVRLEEVGFAYPSAPDRPVLSGCSLHVPGSTRHP